jgi:hypothetical protein
VPVSPGNSGIAQSQRLEVLSAGEDDAAAVRAVFSWSYRALPDPAAAMFRLLGMHQGAEICP